MIVIIKNVRLAFPNLWQPSTFGEGEPKYGATFIVEPSSDTAAALSAAVKQVAIEKWKDKATGILAKLVQEGRVAYHKSPKTNQSGEVYQGFEDMHWVSASNSARPMVVDRNPSVPLTPADGRPYAGCYVNAKLDLWAQDNKWGKRVNASLLVVQYVSAGEAFSGGAAPSIEGLEDLGEGADSDFTPGASDLF